MTVHTKIRNMLSSIFKELDCWIYCPCDTMSPSGKFLVVEIKVGEDSLAALQAKALTDIASRKGISAVAKVCGNEFVFIFSYKKDNCINLDTLCRLPYPMGGLAKEALKNALIKIL